MTHQVDGLPSFFTLGPTFFARTQLDQLFQYSDEENLSHEPLDEPLFFFFVRVSRQLLTSEST